MVGLFSWWYSSGWVQLAVNLWIRTMKIVDFFSIDLLITTLFSPFRQISSSGPGGSGLRATLSSFFDSLISRSVGFFARIFMVLVGLVAIILQATLSVVIIVMWPLVPLMPIAGIVLYIVGWLPL